MDARWAQIEVFFQGFALECRREWQVLPPPVGARADEATEIACDDWCRRFAAQPALERLQVDLPPEPARRWVLARVLYAKTIAASHAKQPRSPAPAMSRSMLLQFLVEEWHGAGRAHWARPASPLSGGN